MVPPFLIIMKIEYCKEKTKLLSIVRFLFLFFLFFYPFNSIGQTAKVNKVWVEHGTLKNGHEGMTIHADVNVKGMKGKDIKAIAYFYDSKKNKLMGGLSGYKTKSGQVCASDIATPSYDNSHYSDYDIFIPYESLPLLSGKRTYYISLSIQDATSRNFISEKSNYVSFICTGSSAKKNVNNISNVRKERIELSDGGYEEYTYYSYGVKYELVKRCSFCFVLGECQHCNGKGGKINPYTHFYENCQFCYGTRKCSFCLGKGYISSSSFSLYNQNESSISNSNGGVNIGGSRTSSGSSYGESSSSYSNCSSCSGSGVCSKWRM